jgi:hypothetical protein
LFSGIHPDHADIQLHGNRAGDRELQHFCDMVCRPYKHRDG